MALKEAVRTAVESIVPPSAAELQKRLEAARTALLAAQIASDKAQAAYDVALSADTPRDGQEAQAAVIRARLDLQRAADRVGAIERQLAAVQAARADAELEVGRKHLAELKAAREQHGAQILAALDALQAAVLAFVEAEAELAALPVAVRGRNAVVGHNLGAGPLQAHLTVELQQRGIVGQPSSVQQPRLADWLALGSRTLGS